MSPPRIHPHRIHPRRPVLGRGALRTGAPVLLAGLVPLGLVIGTLGAVALHAGGLAAIGPRDLGALRFTLIQAALSALLSVGLAIPVARALARRRFFGRELLITLLGAPFILPTIIAAMGLIAIFGRRGMINQALLGLGLPQVVLYGAHGVVLAHVFLNLPLAVRMILHGWQAIPAERMRLAASLDFGPAQIRRHLEWPMLRQVLPGAWLAIFLVCLTSFAVALTLGGGPRATTIELAIYQAIRFDFELGRAASLALIQVALCIAALLASRALTPPQQADAGLARTPLPGWGGSLSARLGDGAAIGLASAFLLAPIAVILARGLPGLTALPAPVWQAAGTSLWLALASMGLTLLMALPLALAAPRHPLAEAVGMVPLTASALVMGTGLFLIARPLINPAQIALPVTLLVNATLSLPFALRLILPEARRLLADYDRLAQSLDLSGLARLRLLTLPRLARPLGLSAGLSAAFSMGDLGVITLFSDGQRQTLPLALYQLMGAYRQDQAAAAAVLLIALTFALFWACDRIGHYADPR